MPTPDHRLALGYGSAWHLLRCLGWHRARFNARLAAKLGCDPITWLDFPPRPTGRHYATRTPIREQEWQRLDFIADRRVQEAYNDYWPRQGSQQNWDAVGFVSHADGSRDWLLVEAKAYPGELSAGGTSASENGGRPMIRDAFRETLESLKYIEPAKLDSLAETWLASYYQYANRLAALNFLSEQSGNSAYLIFVYFCGDRRPDGRPWPLSEAEWRPHLDSVNSRLGLRGGSDLEKRVINLFIDVDWPEQPAPE